MDQYVIIKKDANGWYLASNEICYGIREAKRVAEALGGRHLMVGWFISQCLVPPVRIREIDLPFRE